MALLFSHKFSRQKVTPSLLKADLIPGEAVAGFEYILKPVPLVCCLGIPAIPAIQPPFPRHPGGNPPTGCRQKRSSLFPHFHSRAAAHSRLDAYSLPTRIAKGTARIPVLAALFCIDVLAGDLPFLFFLTPVSSWPLIL